MERITGGQKFADLLKKLHIDHPEGQEDWDLIMDILANLPQVDPAEEFSLEFSLGLTDNQVLEVNRVRRFVAPNDFRRKIQPTDITDRGKPAMQRRRVEIFVLDTNIGVVILPTSAVPENIHRSDYPELPLGRVSEHVDYADIIGAHIPTVRKKGSSAPYKRSDEIEPGIDLDFKIAKNGR